MLVGWIPAQHGILGILWPQWISFQCWLIQISKCVHNSLTTMRTEKSTHVRAEEEVRFITYYLWKKCDTRVGIVESNCLGSNPDTISLLLGFTIWKMGMIVLSALESSSDKDNECKIVLNKCWPLILLCATIDLALWKSLTGAQMSRGKGHRLDLMEIRRKKNN